MGIVIEGVADWRSFEDYARRYFPELWGVELRERSISIGGGGSRKLDLVSSDGRIVGDAKALKNVPVPAANGR